ncbi:hypothetical protein PENTCL1PPCAC_27193 [Pristionchus entomophagus]|uniref:CNNM transmembrane domain-containing protein n=1 Tax=Pristionchus entomophagus TaxID=358040 RepID=A0AAV5UGH6_9BILA|nr:hypothetical protein PENTCL1PPCAC_27193 [Pristionchus entomophagus]
MRTAHGAYASNLTNVVRNVLWVALACSCLVGPPLVAAQGEGLSDESAAATTPAALAAAFAPSPRTPQINVEKKPVISGMRIEAEDDPHGEPAFLGYTKRGVNIVRPGVPVDLFIFGFWLDEVKEIAVSSALNCTESTLEVRADVTEFSLAVDKMIGVNVVFPIESTLYRLCVRQKEASNWVEVTEARTMVSTETPPKQYYFPFWIQVVIISVLLTLSGLFSGLNLGLMALSPQELLLIQKSGSKTERKYADTIIPVREKGNLLLCSLLIGNVMVNSGISILLDDLSGSGYIALLASSAGIVVFGEIFPQSLCVKKGLAVGARTIWLTRFFMVLTWPLAYPISKLLDCILGDEVVAYDRKRLMELIKMSTAEDGLVAEELKIAVGAMEISDKTVGDVMTKIDDVFMLPDTTTLNTKTVAEILRMGYTRIPVFAAGDRNNVVSLLFVKDLALLDPDDNFTIQTVCNYHQHALRFVLHDTPLRVMLEEFKKGDYHLAMVNEIVEHEDQDPSYQLQGVVTLEDIVEEILQAEIVDETDAVMDNVSKMRRKAARGHELSMMMDADEPTRVISVQMQLVTMQWLTTNISAFHQEIIDRGVLEKLIRQHVRRVELTHLPEMFDKKTAIPRIAKLYSKQEYSERFILILEGRALVTIGQDSMTFEAGPWHAFGQEMLQKLVETHPAAGGASITHSRGSLSAGDVSGQQTSSRKSGFIPDFSVTVLDDCTFLEVSCSSWLRALKSTQLSRGAPTRPSLQDDFPLKRQGPLSSSQHSLVEAPSSNGVKRHTSYINPQHDLLRRVKRTAYDDPTKPRSASESEHVELLSTSARIPLIDDSARSQKYSVA